MTATWQPAPIPLDVLTSGVAYRPVAALALAGTAPLVGRQTLLGGFAVRELTGAAPATVQLFDGVDATGELIADITLAANESIRDVTPGLGVHVNSGLTAVVLAGSVNVVVWVAYP
jgi:hypothetical protein